MTKQTPEALAEFAKSARAAEPAKEDKSLNATAKTKHKPQDLKAEVEAATHVLNVGAKKQNPAEAIADVKKLPDRIVESR